MIYIGIDPGAKGCISVQYSNDSILLFEDMTNLEAMYEFLRDVPKSDNIRCALEKVHSIPGWSMQSGNKLVKHVGIIIGMLISLNIKFEEVPPREWRKTVIGELLKKATKEERKAKSIETAKKLFPEIVFEETGPRGGKIVYDGRADALLLMQYIKSKGNVC